MPSTCRIPAPGTRVVVEPPGEAPVKGIVVGVRHHHAALWATVRPGFARGWRAWFQSVPIRQWPSGWITALDADAPHVTITLPE